MAEEDPSLGAEPPPRSWLFVPGAAERFVAKLRAMPAALKPDAVIFDLEDGVASSELAAARRRVAALTADSDASHWLPPVVAVRTHAVSQPDFSLDLRTLGPNVTTLLLPKVNDSRQVEHAVELLASRSGKPLDLIAIIESAAGLENVSAIAKSLAAAAGQTGSFAGHRPRAGLALGAEDLTADLGLPPPLADRDGARLAVIDAARARIVTAAAAAAIACRVDTPTLRIGQGDDREVELEARRSRGMGFSGKFTVHPSHVAAVHRGFEPSSGEVAWARSILEANAGSASAGAGHETAPERAAAGVVAGAMVDEAIVRQARAVLGARRREDEQLGAGGSTET